MTEPRLFCFGLGYSPLVLAGRLLPRGWRVAGTTRSPEKAASLAERGIEAFLFDDARPLDDPARALAGTTHLLSAVPPGNGPAADPVAAAHGLDLLRLEGLRWAGYLSTTGVYGDHGGGWVDEDTPREPGTRRGRARKEAEDAWLDLGRRGLPIHLFRLPGIYGPGRSALDSLRAGTARRVDKPGQVFSRIHVEDIATVLEASMVQPNPGAAYNVCDDEPAPGHEVIAHAARLLGVEPPPLVPFEEAGLSPMAASFYADSKRVRNDRIKRELGVTLAYPSYREGLGAQRNGES